MDKVRKLSEEWHGLMKASKEGRSMVVQSCYYGRYRYYLYSIEMPKSIVKQTEEDAAYMI